MHSIYTQFNKRLNLGLGFLLAVFLLGFPNKIVYILLLNVLFLYFKNILSHSDIRGTGLAKFLNEID